MLKHHELTSRVKNTSCPQDNTPFSGASTYKADFMAVASGPAVMVRPEMGHSIIPPGRFDGTTTYTTDFVKKAIGPREPRPWAVCVRADIRVLLYLEDSRFGV